MMIQGPIVTDWNRAQKAARANRLLNILRKAETDVTLNDALEQLEALYILKYGNEKDD